MFRVGWGAVPNWKRTKNGSRWLMVCLPLIIVSCFDGNALWPQPGLFEYRSPAWIDLAEGRVDTMGGNLVVRRTAFNLDTRLGTVEAGAIYNSATQSWIWSFQASYDGSTFVDETGAVHDVRELAHGSSIPGTHWRKLDAQRISSKGGLVHHFDAQSYRLDRVTWGDHDFPALVFSGEWVDGKERTSGVEQCLEDVCFPVYEVSYDKHGCVSSVEDRAGRRTDVLNDIHCRIQLSRDPLDVARGWVGRSYEYDVDGSLVATTSSEGVRVEYAYLDGRLLGVFKPQLEDSLTLFSYGHNPISGLYFTRVISPGGQVSEYSYDARGRLHEFEDGLGSDLQIEWVDLRPGSLTNSAGDTTRWEYADDDPIRAFWPDGNVVEIEYRREGCNRPDPFATPQARISDSVGVIEYNYYGLDCWLEYAERGDESSSVYAYDALGNMIWVADERGQLTHFLEYGEHGHAQKITRNGITQLQRFDEVGNLLAGGSMTGAAAPGRPGVVERGFDANRNLVRLELEGGSDVDPLLAERASLEVEYRSDGRPIRIRRPYGGDTRFDYDAAGHQVARSERVDGDWKATHYEYSSSGRLIATEWPNGVRHEIDYDGAGRTLERRFMRDGELEKSVRFVWSSGRLTSRLDSERPGEERILYDEVGREVAIHFPEGEVLEFRRDRRGREIERIYRMHEGASPLRTLSFVYDAGDQMVEIWDQGEKVLERQYELGRLQRLVFGNGLETEYTYNQESGLIEEEFTSHSSNLSSQVYVSTLREWTPCGHAFSYCITSETHAKFSDELEGLHADALESYQVGPLHPDGATVHMAGARLQGWSPDGVAEGAHLGAAEYAFDALGNWLGAWEGGEQRSRFFYNAERNRLISAELETSRVYAWDEAGFMLARNDETFIWDATGRPESIGDDHEIRWDSLGRPISYRLGEQVGFPLFGGQVAGNADRVPVRIDLQAVEIDLVSGDHLYRQIDHRGNVHFAMDDSGEVVDLYSYSPFGVHESWGAGRNGRTFAQGQEIGGYIWLQNRLYDPEVGRFLSPDPVYQLVNQFSYTLGNPVFYWDPIGRHSSPNPLIRLARKLMKMADRLQAIGYQAYENALNTGSYSSAFTALVSVVAGITLKWFIEQSLPKVGIEDPPYETGPTEMETGSEGAESGGDVSTCSPQLLQADGPRFDRGWFWFPLQVLLAAFLLWLGRRGDAR